MLLKLVNLAERIIRRKSNWSSQSHTRANWDGMGAAEGPFIVQIFRTTELSVTDVAKMLLSGIMENSLTTCFPVNKKILLNWGWMLKMEIESLWWKSFRSSQSVGISYKCRMFSLLSQCCSNLCWQYIHVLYQIHVQWHHEIWYIITAANN